MLSTKRSYLQKKTSSLKRKNNACGFFSVPIEVLFTFCRIFGESDAEKRNATERRGSMVKYREMSFRWEGLVKILWGSPCIRVVWKLLNSFGWILKNYRNALSLHRVDQLARGAKDKILLYLSGSGIRHILNDVIL